MVFPVVMYGCGSWTIKKAECRRIDAFELWCWRRLLRFPWTARRSNQSIVKEISPGCSLEGLMLKLKLPILWPPDGRSWLIGKDHDAGKDWGPEENGTTEDEMVGWHHRLDGHGFGWTPGVGDGQGGLRFTGSQSRTWLSDWTELNCLCCYMGFSLVVAGGGCLLVVLHRILIAVASRSGAQVCSVQGSGIAAPTLWSTDSVAVAHGLSCSAAFGILLDQGSNPCLLHWQADSLPLDYHVIPWGWTFLKQIDI